MGRPRSKDICPKCGQQGYLEYYQTGEHEKYWRIVHYDSVKRKRYRHYVGIIKDLKKIRSVAYLKQQIKELEITNHNYKRYNLEICDTYSKEIDKLKSKIKKDVFKGKSKFVFENKVIPVKYLFFPNPLDKPKLVIDIDNSKDITNLN
jgi:hypothetical protein